MFDLETLYSGHKVSSDNPLCEGCTILSKNKPCHSHMDYEVLPESPALFLSDSFRYRFGKVSPFSDKELDLIKDAYHEPFVCAASVKCPSVKEGDMSPDNMKLCRAHLEATVDKVKPTLIIPCGNLAMKMLIKKSGILDKRGKSFEFTTQAGHTAKVVPIYHPYSVIREPRFNSLFKRDIINAYEKYILKKRSRGNFNYEVLLDIEQVKTLADELKDSTETLACDIETTGLNFLEDSIMTIAISCRERTWVIPCDHKDSPFVNEHQGALWTSLRQILENPKSKKVFHNAKFDLKFLINYGIYAKNVWDTKIMHHFIDENMPKSLMDLVKLYFPTELEDL